MWRLSCKAAASGGGGAATDGRGFTGRSTTKVRYSWASSGCENDWPNPIGFGSLLTMTRATLTRTLRQAMAENLRDHRDEFRDLLAEVIEDVSLASAIREGEKSKPVKRDAVLRALRDSK